MQIIGQEFPLEDIDGNNVITLTAGDWHDNPQSLFFPAIYKCCFAYQCNAAVAYPDAELIVDQKITTDTSASISGAASGETAGSTNDTSPDDSGRKLASATTRVVSVALRLFGI